MLDSMRLRPLVLSGLCLLLATGAAGVLEARSGPSPVFAISRLARSDRALAELVLRGSGRGAEIEPESLAVIQTTFADDVDSACGFPEECQAPCNSVFVAWEESSENPEGVLLFVDGVEVARVDGLVDDDLPGINGFNVHNVPAGMHTFRIDDPIALTSQECEIDVLDRKPLSDAVNVRCESAGGDASGDCRIGVTWEKRGSAPGSWGILVDDVPLSSFVSGLRRAELVRESDLLRPADLSSGAEHTVAVVPLVFFSPCAAYRGCFVEATCTVKCEPSGCNAPFGLTLCQTSYGPDGFQVYAWWRNGERPYPGMDELGTDGLVGFVDDLETPVGTLPGFAEFATFTVEAPGEHVFALRGDCGPDGKSAIREARFTVLEETPHVDPIVPDSLRCWFKPEDRSLTATWKNSVPSCAVTIVLARDGDETVIGRLRGVAEDVTVTGVGTDDVVGLRFSLIDENGGCYTSDLITCVATRDSFIRGLCGVPDGRTVDISNAITVLNFLFLGSNAPPCLEACKVNDDDKIDISDGVALLTFLFLGGPAPTGWKGASPVCEPITRETDCETPNDACPLE